MKKRSTKQLRIYRTKNKIIKITIKKVQLSYLIMQVGKVALFFIVNSCYDADTDKEYIRNIKERGLIYECNYSKKSDKKIQ